MVQFTYRCNGIDNDYSFEKDPWNEADASSHVLDWVINLSFNPFHDRIKMNCPECFFNQNPQIKEKHTVLRV